jgi:hypothetical protein
MNTFNTSSNLDGRDELLIGLVAGLIPLISLGALIIY